MIEVENLSKHFGKVRAVDGISFEVKEGENLILLGTSGCGKTTTLKMINRLIEPTKGKIIVNGKNVTEQQPEELRRSMGYVLQNTGLFPHYTVAENIAIVPQLLKWDKKRIADRTIELMDKLHLDHKYLNVFPEQLSGGQQQRVGLARALMADPPVLLMDEPFGALDPVTRFNIRKEFIELDELKRKTIIMVTHDVQEAFELGDRICLMDNGKIMQAGTPAELLFKPSGSFVRGFLKEQRLQLEFKAVKLNDIWDLLPSIKTRSSKEAIHCNCTVWETLEIITSGKENAVAATNPVNGETKTITFTQLMSTFYQYQNSEAV
ncbi:glycine/betaine ABC transporter ATP-binding protein [Mucilaginibacter sp. PPCGB 2223]|uniref:ABC transporter ATP-binding protein n=1 Tax=Mucilaginibacter sp. PPCGB 2223 TaxID=1886027 RepID=UPI0008268AEA|nr:ATP-binding cassette domain-containing protein [Mucilaginibacter sp. PPCGB 2223]OCX50895.1 glycine/betaine ABC transporter ATP-binding protein [Mucilaginibacter sp. PPCGB 2223]